MTGNDIYLVNATFPANQYTVYPVGKAAALFPKGSFPEMHYRPGLNIVSWYSQAQQFRELHQEGQLIQILSLSAELTDVVLKDLPVRILVPNASHDTLK
jgi:hypothetical protein